MTRIDLFCFYGPSAFLIIAFVDRGLQDARSVYLRFIYVGRNGFRTTFPRGKDLTKAVTLCSHSRGFSCSGALKSKRGRLRNLEQSYGAPELTQRLARLRDPKRFTNLPTRQAAPKPVYNTQLLPAAGALTRAAKD